MGETSGKTNAMRLLDAAGFPYRVHHIEADPTMSGLQIAQTAGEDPDCVFKTLVTQSKDGEHLVFMVPVRFELDCRKAAHAAGVKTVTMVPARELLALTGYVHGGCSPLGMKKTFRTFIDETCTLFETILFSAGRIGMQVEMTYDDLAQMIDLSCADLTALRAVRSSQFVLKGGQPCPT